MACVEKRGDLYRVRIRKKDKCITASFSDKETAVLWGKYKENLIDEIKHFEFSLEKSITLIEAIDIKVEKLTKNSTDSKSIADIENLKKDFKEFLDKKIQLISYNDFIHHAKILSAMKGKGEKKASLQTVLSKFRRLSSVYSSLIEDGLNIENIPIKITNFLKTNI